MEKTYSRKKEKRKTSRRKKTKNKKNNKKIAVIIIALVVCLVLAAVLVFRIADHKKAEKEAEQKAAAKTSQKIDKPKVMDNQFDISLFSKYAVVLDEKENKIIYSKNADLKCRPASITKILTAIVVLENVKNLDEKVSLQKIDSDFLDQTDLARMGFQIGEEVTIRDCLYCAILQSSADACLMMSRYVAGGNKKFAELMNKKVEKLGLKNCHFDNSIGMDSDGTYITVDEYVLVLKYALKNKQFKKILNTYDYTLKPTNKRKSKWTVTNGLLANIKDNYLIKSGKLGYTDLAELTLASYAEINGDNYLIVTAYAKKKAGSGFRNIFDHERLYRMVKKTLTDNKKEESDSKSKETD